MVRGGLGACVLYQFILIFVHLLLFYAELLGLGEAEMMCLAWGGERLVWVDR